MNSSTVGKNVSEIAGTLRKKRGAHTNNQSVSHVKHCLVTRGTNTLVKQSSHGNWDMEKDANHKAPNALHKNTFVQNNDFTNCFQACSYCARWYILAMLPPGPWVLACFSTLSYLGLLIVWFVCIRVCATCDLQRVICKQYFLQSRIGKLQAELCNTNDTE